MLGRAALGRAEPLRTLSMLGGDALSAFRRRKLLDRLRAFFPHCCHLDARYQHFLSLHGRLTDAQVVVAKQLLDYGAPAVQNPPARAVRCERWCTVRSGTISPWSSKATDIFQRCGLSQVQRVERGVQWHLYFIDAEPPPAALDAALRELIFDPMTESLHHTDPSAALFAAVDAAGLRSIDIIGEGLGAVQRADKQLGLALSAAEQQYVVEQFIRLGRNPTDVELMMFAQVNSEHCRHKIFNADWCVDDQPKAHSPFELIQQTHQHHSAGTLVAYTDNAALLDAPEGARLLAGADGVYAYHREALPFTVKVETHNHPTAVSPFAGAATGAGGEMRDATASGRGGKPKAGLVGFTVSHLYHPDLPREWEDAHRAPSPPHIATPLQIMLQAPIGAAAFNNEFGRPNIVGYFRSFEHVVAGRGTDAAAIERFAYHKPIMLAGGIGSVRPQHIHKLALPPHTPIVVLGGPAMLIGLGGGAASSVAAGDSQKALDFASVQRGNAEMQRRCQEVIDACNALGADSPILSIHDVGAGGLCNALPELVNAAGGGEFELRQIPSAAAGMTPLQLWCNESQERYVLALNPPGVAAFAALCARERCPYAVVGHTRQTPHLRLHDAQFDAPPAATPVDLPMAVLFGQPPKMRRTVQSRSRRTAALQLDSVSIEDALARVLRLPAVADKTFLVSITDRSVTGLVCREQMVGPWQVPVADVGVVASGYTGWRGEALSIGERTPVAVLDAPASARMAVGEAITNIAAAAIKTLTAVKLSANWMAAAGEPGQDADLYASVEAVVTQVCRPLGLAIPVGKDSLSMQSVWEDADLGCHKAVSPLSLVVSAFAPVEDVRRTLTPQLQVTPGDNDLWLLDLGRGKNRLGGSALAQVYAQLGEHGADLDSVEDLRGLFQLVQHANRAQLLLAYHDRSDGGLLTTLCEMAFSARCGLNIDLQALRTADARASLFTEELGAVLQTRRAARAEFQALVTRYRLTALCHRIGEAVAGENIVLRNAAQVLLQQDRRQLHQIWSETSFQMQRLRDNPECARAEYARVQDQADCGLSAQLSFDPHEDIAAPYLARQAKPRVAILREQGVNGQLEMAAAFMQAGFDAVDVTMTDLSAARYGRTLDNFVGLAACGGFSFGDVLGAGQGWAKSILFNPRLRDLMQGFFQRADSFALGVCNGCQMLAGLRQLIPGAQHWPTFARNLSEQYEARFVMVEVLPNPSILFTDMHGSRVAVSVANGEGRAEFADPMALQQLHQRQQVSLRYVDNAGHTTERYPYNPNGSPAGVTGFTTDDGRVTIMMPHPERVFRSVTHSWHPPDWGEYSPWMRLFRNARAWVD